MKIMAKACVSTIKKAIAVTAASAVLFGQAASDTGMTVSVRCDGTLSPWLATDSPTGISKWKAEEKNRLEQKAARLGLTQEVSGTIIEKYGQYRAGEIARVGTPDVFHDRDNNMNALTPPDDDTQRAIKDAAGPNAKFATGKPSSNKIAGKIKRSAGKHAGSTRAPVKAESIEPSNELTDAFTQLSEMWVKEKRENFSVVKKETRVIFGGETEAVYPVMEGWAQDGLYAKRNVIFSVGEELVVAESTVVDFCEKHKISFPVPIVCARGITHGDTPLADRHNAAAAMLEMRKRGVPVRAVVDAGCGLGVMGIMARAIFKDLRLIVFVEKNIVPAYINGMRGIVAQAFPGSRYYDIKNLSDRDTSFYRDETGLERRIEDSTAFSVCGEFKDIPQWMYDEALVISNFGMNFGTEDMGWTALPGLLSAFDSTLGIIIAGGHYETGAYKKAYQMINSKYEEGQAVKGTALQKDGDLYNAAILRFRRSALPAGKSKTKSALTPPDRITRGAIRDAAGPNVKFATGRPEDDLTDKRASAHSIGSPVVLSEERYISSIISPIKDDRLKQAVKKILDTYRRIRPSLRDAGDLDVEITKDPVVEIIKTISSLETSFERQGSNVDALLDWCRGFKFWMDETLVVIAAYERCLKATHIKNLCTEGVFPLRKWASDLNKMPFDQVVSNIEYVSGELGKGIADLRTALDSSAIYQAWMTKKIAMGGPVPDAGDRNAQGTRMSGFLKWAQDSDMTRLSFIAIGRDWIDACVGSDQQAEYINMLIVRLRKIIKKAAPGIEVYDGPDHKVFSDVIKAKQSDPAGRGIVLAGNESVKALIDELSGHNIPVNDRTMIFAGVDTKNLTPDSFIRLLEMLEVLVDMSAMPYSDHYAMLEDIRARHPGLPFLPAVSEDGDVDITRITFLPAVEKLPDDTFDRSWKNRYLVEIAA